VVADSKAVMAKMEKMGNEQRRKIYLRHGYAAPLFGVSFADLGALTKAHRGDHDLALALWKSGNADARILATMIADPARLTPKQAEAWAKQAGFRALAGYVGSLAARAPGGIDYGREWTKSEDVIVRSAGYAALMELLKEGGGLTDKECEDHIRRIEKEIHGAPNWSRYGMMYALIGFGSYKPALTEKAVAAAKRIGKVEFDPGETDCKMPDPVPYIRKTVAHRAKMEKRKK
jgi:3-methyladenine DNA glycosylase AlkD